MFFNSREEREAKSPADVVIELNIKPEEAETLYLAFLRLNRLDKLVMRRARVRARHSPKIPFFEYFISICYVY